MVGRSVMWTALALVLVGLLAPAAAQSPTVKPETLAGVWEGTSRGTNGELPLKVDLRYADGKFGGVIATPGMAVSITGGTLQGDALTLAIDAEGMTGTLSATLQADRIEGTWQVASESGTVVLARGPGTGVGAAGDPISGDWSGEAMVQGQPMPIMLSLKLSGETVTGEISSAMGTTPLTAGGWKDGTLTIAFPYAGGEPVSMVGKIQDGKLTGMFDYNAGEAQGTWFAARK